MAKQQGLTFKDLIKAQEALAAKGDARAAEQVQRLSAMQKSILEQEKIANQDKIMQAVQTVEAIKADKDDDKIVKSIDQLEKETKKGLLEKKGDGLNANVIKLNKTINDSFKGLQKTLQPTAQPTQPAEQAQADLFKDQGDKAQQGGKGYIKDHSPLFKPEGDKAQMGGMGYLKERAKSMTRLDGWFKKRAPGEAPGGFVDAIIQKRMAKNDYREAHMKAAPQTGNIADQRKAADAQFEKMNTARLKMADYNKDMALMKDQGFSDRTLKASGWLGKKPNEIEAEYLASTDSGNKPGRLKKDRAAEEAADKESDVAVPIKKAKVGKLDTNPTPPGATPFVAPSQPANSAAGSEEVLNENNRIQQEQLSLLAKIAENTAIAQGAKPSLKSTDNGGGGGGGLLDGIGKGLTGLGKGIAGLGKGIGKGLQGFLEGLSAGIKSFGNAEVLKGAAAMVILSGALWVSADALNKFNTVDWGSILKGGVALLGLAGIAMLLGKAGPQMVIGAAAMLVLSGALWVTGEALQKFADISWGDIAKGMVALVGLGAIGVILGMFAPAALLGAAALVALGAGLWVVGEAMQAVAEGVNGMIDGITRLGELDGGNLVKVAGGVVALGLSLIAFAASAAAASVGNLIGNLFSLGQDSPVEQLIKIGEVGDGISKAADGIDKLSEAIKKFAGVDTKALGEALEVLNDEFPWIKATLFAKAGASFSVTSSGTTVTSGPAGAAGGGAQSPGAPGAAGQPGITTTTDGTTTRTSAEINASFNEGKPTINGKQVSVDDYVKYTNAKGGDKIKMAQQAINNADQVASKSAQVADAQRGGGAGGNVNTTVVAPTTNVSNTTQAPIRQPVRNTESSWQSYNRARYAF